MFMSNKFTLFKGPEYSEGIISTEKGLAIKSPSGKLYPATDPNFRKRVVLKVEIRNPLSGELIKTAFISIPKNAKQKLKKTVVNVAGVTLLLGTLMTGAYYALDYRRFEDWRAEQIVHDGGMVKKDKDDNYILYPNKKVDPEEYSYKKYREYVKEQKEEQKREGR